MLQGHAILYALIFSIQQLPNPFLCHHGNDRFVVVFYGLTAFKYLFPVLCKAVQQENVVRGMSQGFHSPNLYLLCLGLY